LFHTVYEMAEFKIGTLHIAPALEHQDLLASRVSQAIQAFPQATQIGVAEIDPMLSDTASFCEHYGVGMDRAANCVVLEAKRGDHSWLAACVILGDSRADVNGVARRLLNARKVSFAPMDKAVRQTGMEYGAITPIGLPHDWPILIDKRAVDTDNVIIGSGIRRSKIVIPGNLLALLLNAQVHEELAQARKNPPTTIGW
jgi:prolyl-tRNA editing enzyme YbaK/EbsC (Cys-tRNA(Pro) deacylase)